jgi:hypothetical protein
MRKNQPKRCLEGRSHPKLTSVSVIGFVCWSQKKGTMQSTVPFFEATFTYGLTKFKLILKYKGFDN